MHNERVLLADSHRSSDPLQSRFGPPEMGISVYDAMVEGPRYCGAPFPGTRILDSHLTERRKLFSLLTT